MKAENDMQELQNRAARRLNILWIEDDELQRTSATLLIEMAGHTGDVAGNGDEALQYLEKNSYDLILTDIGMPGLSGWELADIIREKFKGAVKVVVISGWASEAEDHLLKKHGVSACISKPFTVEEIFQLFSDTLTGL